MENRPSATAFDRIFHFIINCTSLERTVPVYQMLGFKVVLDFGDGMESQEMAIAFGLEQARIKGVHLRMGDDPTRRASIYSSSRRHRRKARPIAT